MNGTIFGIGPLEVLVIGILILLVFGPERLPEFTRSLGTALRRLRETYVAFTQEFKGELQPIAQDLDEVTREIRQEVDAIRQAADLRSVLKPFSDELDKTTVEVNKATDDINKAARLDANAPAKPSNSAASIAAASATSGNAVSANTIAPPKPATSSANGNHSKHGNGAVKTRTRRPTDETPAPIALPEDNPWASIGVLVRSDKLDDDSPWRG
jgi:sec-independent protein translocase protein TatB